MTSWRLSTLLIVAAISIGQPLCAKPQEIDLSKPVGESVAPDRLYWTFEEGPDNGLFSALAIDHSPNGYHGRFFPGDEHPAPTFAEGRFGKGLFFQGETPPYIDPNDKSISQRNPRLVWRIWDTPAAWDPSRLDLAGQSFTFGVWLRFHQVKSGEYQGVILVHCGAPPEPASWSISMVKSKRDQWQLRAVGAKSTQETDLFNDGQWHHVGIHVDVERHEVGFWVDGEPLGPAVAMEQPIPPLVNPYRARSLCVGESWIGNFSTGFIGDMDEVFITSGLHPFKAP